jgi:hypothetical protein
VTDPTSRLLSAMAPSLAVWRKLSDNLDNNKGECARQYRDGVSSETGETAAS